MIVFATIWEQGWLEPRLEHYFWRDLAPLGVDKIVAVPDIYETVEGYENLDALLAEYSSFKKVFVESGEHAQRQSIYDYVHPTGDVLYIFGNSFSDNLSKVTEADDVLWVPVTEADNTPWTISIAGIILYDINYKKWQSQ